MVDAVSQQLRHADQGIPKVGDLLERSGPGSGEGCDVCFGAGNSLEDEGVAAGMENGELGIWDPEKILANVE